MCADPIDPAQSVSPASTTVGKPLRLFLALWPDDDVREQLAALGGRWMWPAGSVVYQPGDWHVTLHFIGAVGADRVDAISSDLDVPFEPFDLLLDQPQVWPHGVAVLCAGTVPHQLRQLHDRLGAALQALGLPVDARPYRAHVTLARRAAGAVAPPGAGLRAGGVDGREGAALSDVAALRWVWSRLKLCVGLITSVLPGSAT